MVERQRKLLEAEPHQSEMVAAAGGEAQVREVDGETRIYPKSEKHWKQMSEAYAPAWRAQTEHAGIVGGGWVTERYKMPDGSVRELPAGSGDLNGSLRPAPRRKTFRARRGHVFSNGHTHMNSDPAIWQMENCPGCRAR